MRCDEVQSLQGPYLDSELDARTSLEIEQHLKACPECARLFAEEEKLEARIKAGPEPRAKNASVCGHRLSARWPPLRHLPHVHGPRHTFRQPAGMAGRARRIVGPAPGRLASVALGLGRAWPRRGR